MTDEMHTPPEGGWESLKVDELKDELEARGLPKSGTKPELIARLEDDEVAQKSNVADVDKEANKAIEEAEAEAAEVADSEDAAGDDEASEDDADDDAADEPDAEKKPRRRRGSAETTAAAPTRRRREPSEDGPIVIRARSKYVRSAPRKARLVMDHIRGKDAEKARAILAHTPRAVSVDILKLLNSAIANAEANHELGVDELKIRRAYVDEGPTIKRFQPRALGRATQIKKRSSHMTIELVTTERNGR